MFNYTQTIEFLAAIATTAPDNLDCDGCFEMIAEFAEAEHNGFELSESLKAVRNHLRQCSCCAYEYETLLEAIEEAEKAN